MIFRKGRVLPRELRFTFHWDIVEIVKRFSYLRVTFTQTGSWSETQVAFSEKAQKAVFILNRYLFNFNGVSIKHRLELFHKIILPILNYACETWGFHTAGNIERVHTIYCKRVLNVKRCTQNYFVYDI